MTESVLSPAEPQGVTGLDGRSLLGRAGANLAPIGAVVILGGLVAAAFLAPLPHDPLAVNSSETLQSPSGHFWFGTDRLGMDIFSRTIVSARIDVPLALGGTFLALAIGVPLGLFASTKGRWAEWFMRVVEMLQSFPLLVLAIVIVAIAGNNLQNIIIAIALVNTPTFIRLVRSEALSIRESRFIEAATSIGASKTRVLTRHVLPNVSGTIMAQASIASAHAIIVIAALTFLGIGITPPTASWGAMIRMGSQNMATGEWWVALFAGLAVALVVVCFNLIADAAQRSAERTSSG